MQPLRRISGHLTKFQLISNSLYTKNSQSVIGSTIGCPHNRSSHSKHTCDGTQSWTQCSKSEKNAKRSNNIYATILASSGLIVSLAAYKKVQALSKNNVKRDEAGPYNNATGKQDGINDQITTTNDRVFTKKEVSDHCSLDKGVWITYKGNVYDITEFIKHHPGGSQTIMMGAGGDVEPFWQTYTVHRAAEVQRLLSTYKIGVLTFEDRLTTEHQVRDENNPYSNDPIRNQLLQVHTEQPFNAETPSKLLTPTYLTPTDVFFVRNHLPVPEVDVKDYTLSICIGTDADPDSQQVLAEFTLEDLKAKFKPYSVDSVIQCSGNRRSDLKKIKEIKGLDWKVGAIGNARWTGVRLIDLLNYLGINHKTQRNSDMFNNIKHIQMEGLDCDMTGQSYGASVSADLAFNPGNNIILAYEMNGKPLTRDHGFPLRLVAPGVTGARNVKWLAKIILSHEESHSHWQRKDYKSFSPEVDMFNIDFDRSISIQETPVQSAICDPVDGEQIVISVTEGLRKASTIPVKGYAFSGGGKMIIRVDVSIDGGASWMTAELLDIPKIANDLPDFTNRNQTYSWTRWSAEIPVPINIIQNGGGDLEVMCRAFDSAYNSQPERPETIWNVRGVVNNSWHRIKLDLRVSNQD